MAPSLSSLQSRLMELSKSIDKLRVLYEQYFMGIEKFEPVTYRKQLKQEIRILRESPPNNTALKFLLNKIDTKFKTYEQYWNRILRQIEEGIYEKQIKRLKRKVKDEGLPEELLNGVRTKGELEAALAQLAILRKNGEGVKQEPQKQEVAKRNVIDPGIRNAYEAFVRARLSTGESLEGVTPERFQATIASKIPLIKEKHHCSEVEIRVGVKNGHAILSFSPRKSDE